jgi:hypothetical protein
MPNQTGSCLSHMEAFIQYTPLCQTGSRCRQYRQRDFDPFYRVYSGICKCPAEHSAVHHSEQSMGPLAAGWVGVVVGRLIDSLAGVSMSYLLGRSMGLQAGHSGCALAVPSMSSLVGRLMGIPAGRSIGVLAESSIHIPVANSMGVLAARSMSPLAARSISVLAVCSRILLVLYSIDLLTARSMGVLAAGLVVRLNGRLEALLTKTCWIDP